MPVPLPTFPSATGPDAAASSAAYACSGRTCIPLMSFSGPSQVSPTTGRLQKPSPSSRRSTSDAMRASWTTPTECVFVSPMGEVSIPDSRIHSSPVSSPFPFRRCGPAKTGSSQGLPSCGRTTVAPVRTESPSTSVVWPTRTPGTSVIAFNSPVGRVPIRIPSSLARGLGTAAA
jgi:hypothetical protein